MIIFEVSLLWAATGLYLIGAGLSWFALLWNQVRPLRWTQGIVGVGLVLHTAPLVERWIRIGHGPYISAFEVLSASVWVGLVLFAGIARRRATGAQWAAGPILTVCVVLMGWAVLSNPEIQPLPPTFKSVWLAVHILAAKISFGAILAASGLAVLYLFRASRGQADTASSRSRSALAGLDMLSYRVVAFGFVFVALMIAAGSIWARDAWGTYWSWDPLETWSLVTWVAYGLGLHLRLAFKVRGRIWACIVVGLLVLSIFALFVAALVSPTAHDEFMVHEASSIREFIST